MYEDATWIEKRQYFVVWIGGSNLGVGEIGNRKTSHPIPGNGKGCPNFDSQARRPSNFGYV